MRTTLHVIFLVLLATIVQAQITYTVNTINDIDDGTCDGVHCSLREAINEANSDLTTSIIQFTIPGGGPATILLNNALPRLTENGTTIDGTTQTGFTAGLKIDCSGIGVQTQDILSIFGDDTEIYGLELFGYTISENPMMEGAGSMIGVGGIFVPASPTNVTIGAPGRGNIIHSIDKTRISAANYGNGIGVHSGGNVVIQSNIIGTDINELLAFSVWGEGIRIDETQFGTTYIGGATPAEGNVIVSCNRGIGLFGGEGWVRGNQIGRAAFRTIGNRSDGIILNLGDQWDIGGNIPGEGNEINDSGGHGISVNTLANCYIGYNICTMSGAGMNGINILACDDCLVENNSCLGNTNGIFVDDNGLTTVRIYRNSLGYNIDDGVQANFPPTARDIPITENAHYCNGRGIGIGIKGPMTIFDPLLVTNSSFNGCNGLSSPNATIEIFNAFNPACPDAFCQGVEFIGSTTADATGVWNYNMPLAPGIYTCTQTLPQQLTSPFGACFTIDDCSTIVTTTDDTGPGTLRSAILCANASPGPDTITFDIPGAIPDHVISPLTELPAITDEGTWVAAETQPSGQVILDGTLVNMFTTGLAFHADTSKLTGLSVRNFGFVAVEFGQRGNHVSECIIGTPDEPNMIYQSGICLDIYALNDVKIQGNYIGNDVNFNSMIGASNSGILVTTLINSDSILIGGSRTLREQNYIVNTNISGVELVSADIGNPVYIYGNYFGTDESEAAVQGNCLAGSVDHGALTLTFPSGSFVGNGLDDYSNTFAHTNRAGIFVLFESHLFRNNSFYCNTGGGIDNNSRGQNGNQSKAPPVITLSTVTAIEGTATPNDTVEIYLHDETGCVGVPCQGKSLLGRVRTGSSGDWTLNAPFTIALQNQNQITAIAFDNQNNTSEFSECVEVCPDVQITVSNDGPYCSGDTIRLFSNINSMSNNITYSWIGPGGYLSSDANPIDAVTAGSYFLQANIEGCLYPLAETIVEVFERDTVRLDTTLCSYEMLVVGNETFDTLRPSGQVDLTNSDNCDSIIIVNITFNPAYTETINDTLCEGDFIIFRGERYDESNPNGTQRIASNTSCDSFYSIQLFFRSATNSMISQDLCVGDSIFINGKKYDENNPVGMDTLTNLAGCDSIISIQINFGNARVNQIDTTICPGNFIMINGRIFDENNRTGRDTIPNPGGCDSILDVSVHFFNNNTYILDTILCESDFLFIDNVRYDRFNPTGTAVIERGSSNGCDSTIQVSVTYLEPLFIYDTVRPTCAGKNNGEIIIQSIEGIPGPFTATLNGFGPDPINQFPYGFRNLDEGDYAIIIGDSMGCNHLLQINLTQSGNIDFDLTPDVTISPGEDVILDVSASFSPDSIFWISNGDTVCVDCESLTVQPLEKTIYTVWVYQAGCAESKTVCVNIEVNTLFYFPNSFSPDGNNINDRFNGFGASEGVMIETLEIYTRWGELIYQGLNLEPGNNNDGWDGTFNGQRVNPGVFVYRASISFPGGLKEDRVGSLTILR